MPSANNPVPPGQAVNTHGGPHSVPAPAGTPAGHAAGGNPNSPSVGPAVTVGTITETTERAKGT